MQRQSQRVFCCGLGWRQCLLAQAFGGTDVARAVLDQLYDAASNGPKPPTDGRLVEAQTRVLFAQMHARGIRPPTHSTSGLPKKDSQYGYALVQRTLTALERGEPLPPQARDLLLAQQHQCLITNLRSDTGGRVRCGSCGQFASPVRGHVCARTADAQALRRSLTRRLGVPPSAYGDDALNALLDAARAGAITMRHPATGELVAVTLDALPMAMGNGFVPEQWNDAGRRVVTATGTVLTVLNGTGMQPVAETSDPVVQAATDFGIQPQPGMPVIGEPTQQAAPAEPLLSPASFAYGSDSTRVWGALPRGEYGRPDSLQPRQRRD